MSVTQVTARIAELQALTGRAAGGTVAPTASGPTFAAQLDAASAASPATPAAAAPAAPGGATPYDGLIDSSAARNGIDPALLRGLIRQESNFDPNAGSPAGAQGLTQLMPATAAALGVTDPRDPAQSIEGGARYLRRQLDQFGGDVPRALAAYNAGPGAVQRFGGVPPYPETQSYVRNVLAYAGAASAA